MRKFYSEQWWQRKERAYVEIIDALYALIQHCEIQKKGYGAGNGYSEEKESEFREKHSQALWKIKKTTDIGGFVISSKAEGILKELRDRPRLDLNENLLWELYEQDYDYYRDALNKIVSAAKEDLNANRA